MTNIFETIKKMIGFESTYTAFDEDLVVNINSVLSILFQLGVGDEALVIKTKQETWEDLFGDNENIEMIKSYIYLKVRLIFDPPSGASILTSMENQIKELESRINYAVDPGEE